MAQYRRVALDTNACIYYLEGRGPKAEMVQALIERAVRGSMSIVISAIVQLELLVGPYLHDDAYGVRRILQFTERHAGIEGHDITRDVVLSASQLRGLSKRRLKVPDALVAAAAAVAECDAVVGNDRIFKVLNELAAMPLLGGSRRQPIALPAYVQLDDYVMQD